MMCEALRLYGCFCTLSLKNNQLYKLIDFLTYSEICLSRRGIIFAFLNFSSYLLDQFIYLFMNFKLESLRMEDLIALLNQERKKFIVALDYGSAGSDLEEIRDRIKQIEAIITSREASGKHTPKQSLA